FHLQSHSKRIERCRFYDDKRKHFGQESRGIDSSGSALGTHFMWIFFPATEQSRFFMIAYHGMHLANRTVGTQDVFLVTRLNHMIVVVVGECFGVDEEFGEPVRIEGGKPF